MRRVHANLHPKAARVDAEKVGPLGGMILMAIAEAETISVQKLATQLARDKAQMTRILQSLERKKLLTKARSDDDGRVTMIMLTPRGYDLVTSFQIALADVIDVLLVGIDPTEKQQLAAIMRKALGTAT